MVNLLELSSLAEKCECGNKHFDFTIDKIVIGKDALEHAVSYLVNNKLQKVVLVMDDHTKEAVGRKLSFLLNGTEIDVTECLIKPDFNGDVIANEISLIQAMIEIPRDTDVVLAVGAGTIHDIARFCSYKMEKPFISIPTAPSVDGFNSMGAPIVVRGFKTTFQTQAPIALFADISLLKEAPKDMIAAGFGDMLGKYTSLVDWRFSYLAAGEPYCPTAAQITRKALDACVENVDKIAEGEEEGILILMEALVLSGLAMLLLGHSYPASGGEHHVSHFWEMDFLQKQKPQVLHGAKVSVSTQLITNLYKNSFMKQLNLLENSDLSDNESMINDHKDELFELIQELPDAEEISFLIQKVGGKSTSSELGIDKLLEEQSLEEAHNLRDRFTILKFLNETHKIDRVKN
ncbi:MAG: sn-glycerol-1-phosphate dehydrogenase [Bacillota bacterium]